MVASLTCNPACVLINSSLQLFIFNHFMLKIGKTMKNNYQKVLSIIWLKIKCTFDLLVANCHLTNSNKTIFCKILWKTCEFQGHICNGLEVQGMNPSSYFLIIFKLKDTSDSIWCKNFDPLNMDHHNWQFATKCQGTIPGIAKVLRIIFFLLFLPCLVKCRKLLLSAFSKLVYSDRTDGP